MTYENILYTIEERVCTISLNRPEKMNALSWALRLELRDALKRAERDSDVGCIVIKARDAPSARATTSLRLSRRRIALRKATSLRTSTSSLRSTPATSSTACG